MSTSTPRFDVKDYIITVQGGKEYLPVAGRLVWFREEHPDWGIRTKPVEINIEKAYAIFNAEVIDAEGHLIGSGTKVETAKGFPDFIEKAETGAIGRALAVCGYGTQFAPELEEGHRIVDSPQGGRQTKRADEGSKQNSPRKATCGDPDCGDQFVNPVFQGTAYTMQKWVAYCIERWKVVVCPKCAGKRDAAEKAAAKEPKNLDTHTAKPDPATQKPETAQKAESEEAKEDPQAVKLATNDQLARIEKHRERAFGKSAECLHNFGVWLEAKTEKSSIHELRFDQAAKVLDVITKMPNYKESN